MFSNISIIGYILFFMLLIEIGFMLVTSYMTFMVLSRIKNGTHMQSLMLIIAYFIEGYIFIAYRSYISIWVNCILLLTTYFSGYYACISYEYELDNK